ncbi:polysaccharide deacetylase family protein [Sporosarcina oncorhynchi]|uniref:Polysaccharide deacetylase family protein n=1 Tax=Sporosarcina oncorhynchi TaxID=3056444 RepID=A0ABZ0L808_9BACL|nr:polysaccharide deacetylase family protein [Sporosarcina sp. T2O-4]WOV88635.1 polysaccharide deacetylase family protein [Sporosarcina sp. T2O-4]
MKKTNRKFRSNVWIDITFSITIILLTLSTILLLFSSEKRQEATEVPQKEKVNSNPPVLIEEIDSNYPGVKIVTKTSNDLNAPFAIQYPQSLHNSFNEEIVEYITKAQTNYIDLINKERKLDENVIGELNISFETISHHSGNYSFVFVTTSNVGENTLGSMEIRSFHLAPESGESFTLVDLLDHDSNKLDKVASLVRNAIEHDDSLTEHLLQDEIDTHTASLWKNYSNYAISDEALIFYFDENTIAEKILGPTIIRLPIEDVGGLLSDKFKPEIEKDQSLIADKPSTEETVDDQQSTDDGSKNVDEPVSKGDSTTETPPVAGKVVALTFDDGPDPKVTRQILDVLKKHDAKATFFMLGSRVEYYPEVAKEVQAAGHELGNHTWNHADLTKLSADRISKEINNTSSIIENVTGEKPQSFRPPYGAVNKNVRNQTSMPVVLWDVDTLDWKFRDANKLLEIIQQNTKDGSTILMHDIHQSTADGLDSVLTYLEKEGYSFVTVAELNNR